jgi:hypothetical protein
MVKKNTGKERNDQQLLYPEIKKISRKKLPILYSIAQKIPFFPACPHNSQNCSNPSAKKMEIRQSDLSRSIQGVSGTELV